MPVVNKFICKASECNLNQFISCNFDNDLSVLIISGKPSPKQLEQAWDNIFTEYIDISGLYKEMEELTLMRSIQFLKARNTSISVTIQSQLQALEIIGQPLTEYFQVFESNDYHVSWNGDKKDFIAQMEQIKTEQISYETELEDLETELDNFFKEQEEKIKKRPTGSRKQFLRMINNLEKLGNRIDTDKLSVERFAVMISDYREISETQETSKN